MRLLVHWGCGQKSDLYKPENNTYRGQNSSPAEVRKPVPSKYKRVNKEIYHKEYVVREGGELLMKKQDSKNETYIDEDGLLYCDKCHTPCEKVLPHPLDKGKLWKGACDVSM